ncbi:hypothetical protein [Prolixibacter denitrificans]|uniref:hypothetical protein n=1 Tax=Prolixibacter denitrificans TaxID=1541063 RepID=UPI0011B1D95C|nr:hypothetical protein [Prolixibacter denitrificans]
MRLFLIDYYLELVAGESAFGPAVIVPDTTATPFLCDSFRLQSHVPALLSAQRSFTGARSSFHQAACSLREGRSCFLCSPSSLRHTPGSFLCQPGSLNGSLCLFLYRRLTLRHPELPMHQSPGSLHDPR